MKIKILTSANPDLIDGYRFYEMQAEGVGAYFLDSLYLDIDSLVISAGVHSMHFGKYPRLLSRRFPFAVYYRSRMRPRLSMPSSIAAATPPGSGKN